MDGTEHRRKTSHSRTQTCVRCGYVQCMDCNRRWDHAC